MSLPDGEPARISLVVPLYNEERRLGAFVESVAPLVGLPLCPGYLLAEVVLVDDGSHDATGALIDRLGARTGWTAVPARRRNHGKGDAVARGAQASSGTHVLLSDVDLAAPLRETAKLAAALAAGADIAIGSRDVAGSTVTAPRSRVVVGRSFNGFVRLMTGLDARDTQCGFKLLPADLARSLLSSLLVPGLAFDIELLMRARNGGHRVDEVPIAYHHGEDSSVRPAVVALPMARDVVRLALHLRLGRGRSRSRADAEAPV